MKLIKFILTLFLFMLLFAFIGGFTACKSKTVFVPVESVKTEYIDRIERDSVHLYDSIFVERFFKGDTVFQIKEKYEYLYRDKIIRDSVFINDTIRVSYPVKGDTEYKMKWYEEIIFYIGLISILILLIYLFIKK